MQFTRTNPVTLPLVKNTVASPTEQKLKLQERGEWLKTMIANCKPGSLEHKNFEQDLKELRELYRAILPDSEIQARCERLAKVKAALFITDNRQAYRRQTDRAVTALCGGAV